MVDDKKTVIQRIGIGFLRDLTTVLIILKLTKVIAWSWFWVLSPLIFATILLIVSLALLLIWIFTFKE